MRKLFLCVLLVCVHADGQTRPARKPNAQTRSVAKPLSLEKLISHLQDVARKEYTEAALIRKITKEGVAFQATPENLARLSGGGASPALLATIERLSPVIPPRVVEAPKPDPTGSIDITCAPAECSVIFGREPATSTQNGKLLRGKLPLGSVSIELTKEGFLPFRSKVAVQNHTVFVNAVLLPDDALRMSWGAQLKTKIIEALGGQAELERAHSFLAFGSATVWGQGGVKSTCSVEAFLRDPGKAFFRARSGKRSVYELDLFPLQRSKTNLGESEARNLEVGMRLFSRYNVTEMLKQLSGPDVQIRSESVGLHDGTELQAQTGTEKLTIVLDQNGRPKELREDVPLGEGVRALFSAYSRHDNIYLPSKVTIVYAGSPKQGIELQFNEIRLNPALKETDYRVKKGAK